MKKPVLLTLNIQVGTQVPGSKVGQLLQVDAAVWNDMSEDEKQRLVERQVSRMVKVTYAVVPG